MCIFICSINPPSEFTIFQLLQKSIQLAVVKPLLLQGDDPTKRKNSNYNNSIWYKLLFMKFCLISDQESIWKGPDQIMKSHWPVLSIWKGPDQIMKSHWPVLSIEIPLTSHILLSKQKCNLWCCLHIFSKHLQEIKNWMKSFVVISCHVKCVVEYREGEGETYAHWDHSKATIFPTTLHLIQKSSNTAGT